ncbi:MAG: hypothetical protein A4E28_02735 [Methanocella sp. PtaU1.Bin125]|nr:MAG: hypothetical protein A4E28_02735 [Methanocella sp. PtaU1.Bin125]
MSTLTEFGLIENCGENLLSNKTYPTLNGSTEMRINKILDGTIIALFNKTPVPKNESDVVCPHFIELKWANGCKFDCAWCFLQGTYRFHPEWKNGSPKFKDYKTIEAHIKRFIAENSSEHELLNAGELSDALLSEGSNKPFSRFIVRVLDDYDPQGKYRVLFLTKSTLVKNIVDLKRPDRIVMGFSLNADIVSKKWEHKAPTIKDRIKAAKKVYDAGYQTRVRIDPMVPIEKWKEHYSRLVDDIFSSFVPDRITIGSLRGLQSTINNSKDKSWVDYLSVSSNWGRKIDDETRYNMYNYLISYLNDNHKFSKIALCKETLGVWSRLKLNYKKIECNCTF